MLRSNRWGTLLMACGALWMGCRGVEAQERLGDWGVVVATTFHTGGPTSAVHSTALRSLEVVGAIRGVTGSRWRVEFPVGFIVSARLANTALGPATGFGLGPTREWRVGSALRTTARAVGVRPFGARLIVGPDLFLVQAEAAVGGLLFNIPAPASNTSRFNYTAEVGVGVRVSIPHGHLNGGYRLHHLSNGGRGRVNPGVDSHMLYFGMSWS